MDFRRDFTLAEVPESAELRIAADSKYYLYVNGEQVVFEGGLNRANTTYTYYDVVDVADYLVEGANSFAVLLWYWGGETEANITNQSKHYLPSGQGGLLLASELVDSGSQRQISSGDGMWYARQDSAYKQRMTTSNLFLGETSISFDASEDDGWTAKDYRVGGDWSLAIPVGNDAADPGHPGDGPWNELRMRSIPMFKNFGLTKVSPDDCTVQQEGSNTIYTLTLPYNMQIMPYIELTADSGKEIEMYTETEPLSDLTTTYITKNGEQSFEGHGWINGDYLYFKVPSGVTVNMLGYRQTGYYLSESDSIFMGSFDSVLKDGDATIGQFTGGWSYEEGEASAGNNFFDELWTKSVYTTYVCMRDSYYDCPDRERGQYIGDAVNEIEEAFYAFGPNANALSLKAIRDICEGQQEYEYEGRTYYAMSCIEPGMDRHEIQTQILATAIGAWNYYLYTGDGSIADCYLPLYNYLTNFGYETEGPYAGTLRMRTKEELMQCLHTAGSDEGFAEWTDWGNNQDKRIAINCWWYLSAVNVLNLATLEGSGATQEQIAWLEENMAQVKANFSKFWNEDLSAYATEYSAEDGYWRSLVEHEDGSHLVDDRVNALAVVAGLADADKYAAIRDVFMGTGSAPAYENASIYMEKYVLQALYMMGYPEDAMARMAKRLMTDVNDATSSTLPEYYTVPGEESEGTKNHGWSGSAIIHLSRYAAGIEPLSAGYSAWRICPQMGNFAQISVTVPSEIGLIEAQVAVYDDRTEFTLVSPGGRAEVYVPVQEGYSISEEEGVKNKGYVSMYGKLYILLEIEEAGTYSFVAR